MSLSPVKNRFDRAYLHSTVTKTIYHMVFLYEIQISLIKKLAHIKSDQSLCALTTLYDDYTASLACVNGFGFR